MILVDTSVWIRHLRSGDSHLASLLADNRVMIHPMVIGELACGHLRDREQLLGDLRSLPTAPVPANGHVLLFLEVYQLMGRGIGYIDINLLAAAALAGPVRLWTSDRRLLNAATEIGLEYTPPSPN